MSTISIITAMYNERILAPLFLRHYRWVDEINVLLDSATTDGTRSILESDSRVKIHDMEYPADGLDWTIKQERINELAKAIKATWTISADADEFIFPAGGLGKEREWLEDKSKFDVIYAGLFTVYRHRSDLDLDLTIDPIPQRRHGDKQIGVSYGQHNYVKPSIVKTGSGLVWDCGHHTIVGGDRNRCNDAMCGAHWCMADPMIALERRLAQKARQGQKNLKYGLGVQNHHVTEEQIKAECDAHLDDPIIFE